jgi:RNA polymerase sigma-70 factor (ECF subfamily)
MGIINQNDIVTSIRNNDPAAENELVKLYYRRIRMIVSLSVNDSEDRKEIINDILIAVILKIRNGSFDAEKESSLTSYVYGITRNSINQYLKKLYKKRHLDQKLRTELPENHIVSSVEKSEFEKNQESENNKKMIRKLINGLKPKYRNVIYFRYYDNLSVAEISKKMGIPPQKVSDYLKYAKQLLMQGFPRNK